MGYQIIERLLPLGKLTNRPGKPFSPIGVIIHETATPGAIAEDECRYFSSGYRGASAHYFIDDKTILRVIPENEVAWHAGPTANRQYLSIELCHFKEPARFEEVWKRGVWLAADMCRRYGWNPDMAIHSHAWVSRTYHETDHTDPEAYFAAHGKNMELFIDDVKKEMAGQILVEVLSMFQDVPKNHWAAKDIEWLAQKGIIRGDEQGNFGLGKSVKREELAAVIARVLQLLGVK